MKKMPCVFVREFHGRSSFTITGEVTPGCEWVLAGEGVATRKWDGTACMVRDGKLFKRYDAKRGKTPPPNFEPCGEPDEVTGHHPGWIPVGDEPESKWIRNAWHDKLALHIANGERVPNGTYEAIGPRIGANSDCYEFHTLMRHGEWDYGLGRGRLSFEGIREHLRETEHEGIVFHHPDGRMAKIRRGDFGFAWPVKATVAA